MIYKNMIWFGKNHQKHTSKFAHFLSCRVSHNKIFKNSPNLKKSQKPTKFARICQKSTKLAQFGKFSKNPPKGFSIWYLVPPVPDVHEIKIHSTISYLLYIYVYSRKGYIPMGFAIFCLLGFMYLIIKCLRMQLCWQ